MWRGWGVIGGVIGGNIIAELVKKNYFVNMNQRGFCSRSCGVALYLIARFHADCFARSGSSDQRLATGPETLA